MSKPLNHARSFLMDVDAQLPAALLKHATYTVDLRKDWLDIEQVYVEIHAPPPFTKALESLPDQEKVRILRAIAEHDTAIPKRGLGADRLLLNDVTDAVVAAADELLAELVCQRELLIDVATGGARFNDVNDYYKRRRRRLQNLLAGIGKEDPIPFGDLWDWHKYWCDEGWETYAERRSYIYRMYDPIIEELLRQDDLPDVSPREPTGWERVDRVVAKARAALDASTAEEDFQLVGLLCREALISLAQAVYEPDRHPPLDGVAPSQTDAKRMLESFIGATVPGESNEIVRRHAKASLSLAVELQHRRTASFRVAAMCFEATASTINVVAILDGRRDRAV